MPFYTFEYSSWSNDTSEAEWEKEYAPSQYVEFFYTNKIVFLFFDYELETDSIVLNQRLMFEKDSASTSLEIICYREPILGSANPKAAVETAISEFRRLKHVFDGDALFIGPDGGDLPDSYRVRVPNDGIEHEWLRIE